MATHNALVMASLVVLGAGCDSADKPKAAAPSAAEDRAAGEIVIDPVKVKSKKRSGIEPAQLDLDATATLIRGNRVKSGKELEAALNGEQLSRVDVDHDGKRDRLWVVEVVAGDHRIFDIRAVPSSQASAKPHEVAEVVATIELVPDGDLVEVTVEYDDIVIIDEPPVITFETPIVADTFWHWALVIDRPIFVGVAYVVIEERVRQGKYKHKKHKKHKKRRK